jgi:hypothetical protein
MSAGTGMEWVGMGRIGIKLEMSTEYGFKNRYLVDTLVWLHINQERMTEILPSLSLWPILLSSQCLELFVSRSMGEVSSGNARSSPSLQPGSSFYQFILPKAPCRCLSLGPNILPYLELSGIYVSNEEPFAGWDIIPAFSSSETLGSKLGERSPFVSFHGMISGCKVFLILFPKMASKRKAT